METMTARPETAGDKPRQVLLMEIERELSGPDAAEALARYDAVLSALEDRIADALGRGLSPDDFARTTQLREANVVARKLLRLAVRDGGPRVNNG